MLTCRLVNIAVSNRKRYSSAVDTVKKNIVMLVSECRNGIHGKMYFDIILRY